MNADNGDEQMKYISHPRIKPDSVEERSYQVRMAKGCLDRNTLLILPTGLGKTIVALEVIADMLEKGKVLILAPTKPLVGQHQEVLDEFLLNASVGMMTGNMSPDKRADLMSSHDVIISTPQSVANDLEASRYTLDGFSLVVFDEAHKAVGNYAYVRVAAYCDKTIRCVGMTASPGSDTSRIEEVCMNLDLRRIDIRSDDDPDVSPYVHDTYVNRIVVKLPDDLVDVIALMKTMLDHYIDELVSLRLMNPNWPASRKHLLVVGQNLQSRLSRGEKTAIVFRGLTVQAIGIKILHAISLAETQSMSALRSYLEKIESEAKQEKGGKGAKEIINRPEYPGIRNIVDHTNVEHPKISRVMSLVSRTVSEGDGSKVIVFTQFRETCDLLVSKLSGIPDAKVAKLVGQANGGLKQREQIALLDSFRSGEYNVVVSTSVGEEGLDISSTNAVIFYEPVPSEIRTIQRRGRTGRKNDGEVFVLIAKGTMDEVFDRSSYEKERAMRERLEKLSDDLSRGRSDIIRKNQMKLDGF